MTQPDPADDARPGSGGGCGPAPRSPPWPAAACWFYRAGLVISVVVLLVQIFALPMVWTSVYADRAAVTGSGGVGDSRSSCSWHTCPCRWCSSGR